MPLFVVSSPVIVGSLILLVSCDIVTQDLQLVPTSVEVPKPSQPEVASRSPEGPAVPGFMAGSQESGISSEENEDAKTMQPLYFWDEGGEVNGTVWVSETLDGYSPSFFQPSSSPAETPSDLNSSSSIASVVESLDPEMWESQGESSGSPGDPVYSLSTVDGGSLTQATTTDSDVGAVRRWGGTVAKGTAAPEREELSHTGTHVSAPPYGAEDVTVQGGHHPTSESQAPEVVSVVYSVGRKGMDESLDGTAHQSRLTTVPPSSPSSFSLSPSITFTGITWDKATPTSLEDEEPEFRHGGAEILSETKLHNTHLTRDSLQVVCVDWSYLPVKGYVILNMSENYECDKFRVESGKRLLEMLETAFSRKMNSPQGSWLISLSKPMGKERQLLMTLASEQGVIATKDVLSMLGEIRRGLSEIGIQNYTSVTTCQSRPSPTRSDYGKLFVVLVIIGSICVVIIASGLIYICWQRRLPKMKNMSRGEELHFVENGCHDNPTLDVTSDSQSEMQEKKSSANGVMAGSGSDGGWHVLVNKTAKEAAENMEEDTHL
ncbi:podocalyxin-like protein 2 [Scleropages formosus]|uniref:Podocalyxin-like protein 2-like n=1 Tax=Scleropages formosus TaxID=113540 RepID=A0A8C9REL0_SCLFO|nr:podocalyxin-like protein 2 [Scleropages formosus]